MNQNFLLILAICIVGGCFEIVKCQNAACSPGFVGSQCSVCLNDAACATKTNNQGASCATSFLYSNVSVVKPYVCDPTSPSLVTGLIVPGSLLVQCFTGLPPPPASSPAPTIIMPVIPAPAPSNEYLSKGPTIGTVATAPPVVINFPVPQTSPPPTTPLSPPPDQQAAPAPKPSPLQQIGSTINTVANGIGSLINGRRLAQAPSTSATIASTPITPYCDIGFQVKSPSVGVQCKIDQCSMTPGSSQVVCAQAACACVGDPTCSGNSLISSLVDSVKGQSSFKCGENGVCSLQLAGLPISSIGANCTTGECIIPYDYSANNENNGSAVTPPPAPLPAPAPAQSSSQNLTANALIAAVPSMVLILIISFISVYTFMNRSLWVNSTLDGVSGVSVAPVPSIGTAATAAAKKSAAIDVQNRIDTLEFKDVSVTVPLGTKPAELKRQALMNKALGVQRHNTFSVKSLFHHRDDMRSTEDDVITPQPSENATEAAEFVVGLHGTDGNWCVIDNCSGTIIGGEVMGVIGPSGCGKTTLLGVLAGSAVDLGAGASVTGSVLVDGAPRKSEKVAYVPQADHLIPTLTVQECVRYSAMLRLPKSTTPQELKRAVHRTLDELGLRHVAESQVGGSGMIRGISGGERRRVSIAMELVTNPSIIVLDEPTSGLDSYTALNLIRSLRHVAAAGRIVIASLHQPSKDMFFALDKIVLMGQGRMLYIGRPEEAEASLAGSGLVCPAGTAMAEYMLRVASSPKDIMALIKGREASSSMPSSQGNDKGHQSPETGSVMQKTGATATTTTITGAATPVLAGSLPPRQQPTPNNSTTDHLGLGYSTDASPDEVESQGHASPGTDGLDALPHTHTTPASPSSPSDPRHGRPGLARQFSVMFWRTFVDIIRNPTLLALHVSISTFVGIITGAIFWQLGYDSVGVQNRLGGTFFVLAFLAFTSLTTVDLLMNERAVAMREVRSGYYHPITYLVAKLALDGILLRVIPAVLYWAPFYYMAGFQSQSQHAAAYLFTLIAFNCTVGALSMAVTVASNTAGQSSFIMNFILLFSLAFTGFLVNVNSIPVGLRWIHYLSVFYYAFESMLNTELNGQTFTFIYQASPTGTPINIPDISGETFLTTLGFNPARSTLDTGILISLYFGFVLLSLGIFMYRTPKSSGMMKKRGRVNKKKVAS